MDQRILDITGEGVLSIHLDISTQTGEEVVLYTLQTSPPRPRGVEII